MRRDAPAPDDGRLQLSLKQARRVRIAVIRSDYHREMADSLERKCIEALVRAGVSPRNIHRVAVPGCFEIPLAAQRLAARRKYDALIALGVVIRGDTYHFDLVANECARGVMIVSLKYNVPIIFEVLATYHRRDAARRSANDSSNKGIEAANAALSLLAALTEIAGR